MKGNRKTPKVMMVKCINRTNHGPCMNQNSCRAEGSSGGDRPKLSYRIQLLKLHRTRAMPIKFYISFENMDTNTIRAELFHHSIHSMYSHHIWVSHHFINPSIRAATLLSHSLLNCMRMHTTFPASKSLQSNKNKKILPNIGLKIFYKYLFQEGGGAL